jgi:hypothetical protein
MAVLLAHGSSVAVGEVPEPGAMAIFGVGAVVLLLKRRSRR